MRPRGEQMASPTATGQPAEHHPVAADFVPVVTRATDIQFRQPVYPGETVRIEVTLQDQAANAYRFVGRIFKAEKLAARLEFTCMLVDKKAFCPEGGLA